MIKIRENVRRVQRMVIDAQVKLMERLSSPVRQSFSPNPRNFPQNIYTSTWEESQVVPINIAGKNP